MLSADHRRIGHQLELQSHVCIRVSLGRLEAKSEYEPSCISHFCNDHLHGSYADANQDYPCPNMQGQ
jgi:hypothetical protein